MISRKYAAAAAFIAVSMIAGALLSGCAEGDVIPASSASGASSAPTSTGGALVSIAYSDKSKHSEPTQRVKPVSTDKSATVTELTPQKPVGDAETLKKSDDSYFDDAVFIGDSLTEGFQLHGGITNATYYGFKNLNVKEVYEKKLVKSEVGKITIAEALKQRSFGKYYIMLGANELGWVYPEVFTKKYSELIDLIREKNPEAKIYLQSVLPVTAETSRTNQYYSNDRINYYDELIAALAEEKGTIYLNVREAVENEAKVLPDDAATDGVHLNKNYCIKWADYLREHK